MEREKDMVLVELSGFELDETFLTPIMRSALDNHMATEGIKIEIYEEFECIPGTTGISIYIKWPTGLPVIHGDEEVKNSILDDHAISISRIVAKYYLKTVSEHVTFH